MPASALPGSHTISATGSTSGLSAQAGFVVEINWRQFRFDAGQTGANPSETILTPATVSGLHESWEYYFIGISEGGVTEAGGLVYVSGASLLALDEATGKLKSSFPVEPAQVVAGEKQAIAE